MKVLKTQTLRGPNYWSIRRTKLIVIQLDLEELTEVTSNDIPGFYTGIVKVLPSLIEHHCSRGYRGGFCERIQEGTLMGHIIEHVALELQELAGIISCLAFFRMNNSLKLKWVWLQPPCW